MTKNLDPDPDPDSDSGEGGAQVGARGGGQGPVRGLPHLA